jgi:uncharacterized protein YuzE|tara:strand:- start:315 stop:524 length:210 start_codon:yes stop_codon:yes gene_type:complete
MKVRYDPDADALYIEIVATTVVTKRLDQDIAIDYDAEGHIAGIEILSAGERVFGKDNRRLVRLENVEAA